MAYHEQQMHPEEGGDYRTEEDQIIELLGMEGSGNMFEDTDFIPNRQSLYDNEGFIPYYDTDVTNFIVWKRPHEFCSYPCYFHESFDVPSVIQGTLLDDNFIGVLSAVAAMRGGELLENIVYSRPDDFQQFGVFTCRFYVEGAWVEVITDTRVPCLLHEATSSFVPVYSRSSHKKELWVTLLQKAYAKALGSYEAVSKARVSDVLLHLTGGSVQEVRFHEEGGAGAGAGRESRPQFAKKLKKMLSAGTLIVAKPHDSSSHEATTATAGHHQLQQERGLDHTQPLQGSGQGQEGGGLGQGHADLEGLMPDKHYHVLALKEVNISELVLLHCPCFTGEHGLEWEGDWSDGSAKWDEYPEVLQSVQADPAVQWRRNDPRGFLWMSLKDFLRLFQGVHCCQLFSQNSSGSSTAGGGGGTNYYFDKGEFRDRQAGGPMASLREREEGVRAALQTEHDSLLKATASVIADGDSSWFNNPQYRLSCALATRVTISLIPVSLGEEGGGDADALAASSSLPLVQLTVAELPKGTAQDAPFLGDCLLAQVVATDRGEQVFRQKGQEASIWDLRLAPAKTYFIVPNTARRGQTCGYVLRVFSSGPVSLEKVPPLHSQCLGGEWAKSSSTDSTGGPPRVLLQAEEGGGGSGGGSASADRSTRKRVLVDNSKWCQNSQFHLRLDDAAGGQDDVFLKVVLRRTDRGGARQTAVGGGGDCHVGFVVCKPELLQERAAASKSKLGKPRLNPFGDVIAAKPSSLQTHQASASSRSAAKEQYLQDRKSAQDSSIARKIALDPLFFHESTGYAHRSEACMFFPRVPRSWMPDGLLIVPSLSEVGARGTYDLEVYASKPVVLQQIKDQRCRSVAGEWVEGAAGGSHICPTWKRNPHFSLSLKCPLGRGGGQGASCAVRISLCKSGSSWRAMSRADAVASMVGFYVFVVTRLAEGGEQLRQIYETDFAPTAEVSTEPGFELQFLLGADESYLLLPCTFEEGRLGSFVLTVAADCDFTLLRDDGGAPPPSSSSSHK